MTQNQNQSAAGIAVVTGASAGIGAIYADRLAKRGYDLLLVARRGDRLDALAQRLRADYNISVETLVADLAKPADLDTVVGVINSNDRISMLINNAGVSKLSKLADANAQDQDAMIALNVTALTRLSIAALAKFLARDKGTIINIGSVLSFHTLPLSSVYSGTKGYVMNFTWGLQQEVADTNVHVQLVLPATTGTDLWEISGVPLSVLDPKIIMTPENLVDAALAGLDQNETITLPSVAEGQLWTEYDTARLKLLGASQVNTPAPRYQVR